MRLLTAICTVVPALAFGNTGMWLTDAEIASLDTNNSYWQMVVGLANDSILYDSDPDILADQNDNANIIALAKALAYKKTGLANYRASVSNACLGIRGTEKPSGRTLALGRNLAAFVIAADVVGLEPAVEQEFKAWLDTVRYETLNGRTLVSTHEDRPNNWGTMCGASRVAAAVYLGDTTDLSRAATVFRGFCGDTSAYDSFTFRALYWQYDTLNPVPINPLGATKPGPDLNGDTALRNIDGVLPDDQRRWQDPNDPWAGEFIWCDSALKEEYPWEALQGIIVQAELLHRQGYDAFNWQDRAVLRAYRWLIHVAESPADGDDTWQMPLLDYCYGASYWDSSTTRHGKIMGLTCFTHGQRISTGVLACEARILGIYTDGSSADRLLSRRGLLVHNPTGSARPRLFSLGGREVTASSLRALPVP